MAFIGVTFATLIVAALVAGLSVTRYVSNLDQQQHALTVNAAAAAAGASWLDTRRWTPADVAAVSALASQVGVEIRITDASGRLVGTSDGFARLSPAGQRQQAVVIRGRPVGVVTVRFSNTLSQALLSQLWRTLAIASALASLLALVVALLVSRLITSPLSKLMSVVRSNMTGLGDARVGRIHGPYELQQLASVYDQMADRRERQDRAHRNLVADLAHELRTPVAVLQAGHEAMLDGVVKPTPEQLSALRDQVLRLAHMVDELQRLSSAESAALQLTLVTCDLADLARQAADGLSEMFTAVGIKLITRLDPVPVRADRQRLLDVIVNLLTNALKYTQTGGEVVLKTGPEGERAVLRVSDNGPGIAPDELPRIFDRFFRGRQAAAVAGGSGIGLTIVAALVKAHNGRLDVSSDLGHGTRFVVSLPVAKALAGVR